MPYKIRAGGQSCPFEVVRADTGKRVACHPSRAKAQAHMRALYANEPSAGKASSTMNMVEKSVEAAVTPIESEHPNGEFEVVLSTEALDRDGEHLWIDEWKQPLPARIHIDGDHGRSLEKTVGSVVPRIEGDKLIGKGVYASTPYAQMVRQLVGDPETNSHGISMSVTYGESKNQKDGKPQRELFNAAFVAVPANIEAVVLSSKSAKAAGGMGANEDATKIKHDEMVQAVHDAAVHLGAQCLNDIAADPGIADGANKGVDGPTGTVIDKSLTEDQAKQLDLNKSSILDEAGLPQESTEETTAKTADKAAEAADESADDVAKQRLALSSRALEFLITKNFKEQ